MTREQLERLAEKINGKYGKRGIRVDVRGPLPWLHFNRECFCFDTTDNDQDNAMFIVWALDRLEELGLNPQLWSEDGMFKLSWLAYGDQGYETVSVPTRAEALALALLKKLEEE